MIKQEKCLYCGKIFWSGGVFPQHVCNECQMRLPEVYNYSWGVDMAKEGTEDKTVVEGVIIMPRECCDNCINKDTQLCTYCEVGPYLTRENNFKPMDETEDMEDGEEV